MQFITSSISTMLVLLLLGMVVFFMLTANNLSVYVRENIGITLVLSDDMKESSIIAFQKQLEKKNYIKKTTYISKAEALKEQTQAMGTDPVEFLGHNPFSASLELKLAADYATTDSIAWIEQELRRSNKYIMEVNYPQELLDSVNRNIRKLSLFLLGLAGLLTLISFALINNTIRLTIYSKRFLIHTMKLVGASWSFIRRPFMARSFWIGIVASVFADAVLMGLSYLTIQYEPDLIAVVTPYVMLIVMALVFVFGILITAFCTLISINKFLRMKASNLYYI